MPQKFRKLPIVIEAAQWFQVGDHDMVLPNYRGHIGGKNLDANCGAKWFEHGWIRTLEGDMLVCPGDWIITGIKGEHYPCKPDIFAASYEPADEKKHRPSKPVDDSTATAPLFETYQLEHSQTILCNTHAAEECVGEKCPIHRKTDHPLRQFPQHWRDDIAIIERICEHGVGHPDPDSPWPKDDVQWFHGCCGCCSMPTPAAGADTTTP